MSIFEENVLCWEERLPEDLVDYINDQINQYYDGFMDDDELRDSLEGLDLFPEEVEAIAEKVVTYGI